ncbi:MAG: 50S ribosomal protein L17 [Candidatus Omnitrophica bacterium]|nr:50S ribosomal protein L17 [Candidatus Omnitrophota bacterium]MBU4140992.1 50S ribosomal protein L17 [Candidatus Omnitrophota bacterium]
MRHRKFSQRLSRPMGQRRALLRNMVINLLKYQKIKTTKAKARFVRSSLERLISLAKKDGLQSRRQAYRILDDRTAVNELFSRITPLFKNKNSGFSRIIRASYRRGDGAELVFLELTEKAPEVKPAKPAKVKPEIKPEEKAKPPREKPRPPKELKPKKFLGGLRKLFKKERDSL